MRVSVLGSARHNPFTDGGRELFDCAAQGRIDAFFLGGGADRRRRPTSTSSASAAIPRSRVRWPGSFGSAYLYFLVPRVILFREEHTPRVLVPRVEFISAPGTSPADVYRPGGPYALVTGRCGVPLRSPRARFLLQSVHPGPQRRRGRGEHRVRLRPAGRGRGDAAPSAETLALIRGPVVAAIAETYPRFAERVLGIRAAASA